MGITIEMDSQVERRITLRLLAYWERLRDGRAMPGENDINPDDIQDLWDHCFLVAVKDIGKPDYSYTYLGTAILQAYRDGLSEEDAGGALSLNAAKLTDSFLKVAQTARPLLEEGEFRNFSGKVVRYRQCLLPLGQDGVVDAIFGGMRYKLFEY